MYRSMETALPVIFQLNKFDLPSGNCAVEITHNNKSLLGIRFDLYIHFYT